MPIIKSNVATIVDAANKQIFGSGTPIERDQTYMIPEIRAYSALYSDPLSLCFKFMIDYDKPYGLFAPETSKDSALAYLKRLEGSSNNIRYAALKNWIENFQLLVKYYDFLFLEIEGLDQIINQPPQNMFIETESKINLKLRETIDMRVMQLIEGYRHIVYDQERGVEVIPENLRRFDAHVVLYPAAYYNMALYSEIESNGMTEQMRLERKILPTLDKVCDDAFLTWDKKDFNNLCFNILDCMFNVEESGKSLFDTVSSEMSSSLSYNNLSFTFRFANYRGIFNNTRGEIDLVNALAQAAAQNKAAAAVNVTNDNLQKTTFGDVTKRAKNNVKAYFKDLGAELANQGRDALDAVKNLPGRLAASAIRKVTGANTPIGNAYNSLSVSNIGRMIKSTVELGIEKVEDKLVNQTVTKLNSMMRLNYNDNLYDFYKNEVESRLGKNKKDTGVTMTSDKIYPSTNVSNPTNNTVQSRRDVENGIKYKGDIGNIYTRKGF